MTWTALVCFDGAARVGDSTSSTSTTMPGRCTLADGLARRGASTLIWNQGLRLGEFILTFLASWLYARWLGPSEYGRYALVLAVVALAPLALSFGIDEALNSFTARIGVRGSEGRQAFLFRVGLAIRVGSALLVGAFIAAVPVPIALAAGDAEISGYLIYAAPYLVASQAFSVVLNMALGRLDSGWATVARVSSLGASLAATWVLLSLGFGVVGVLLSMGVSTAGAAAWLLWRDRRLLLGPVERIDLSPVIRFGWTTWLLNLSNYVLGRQLDLFLVAILLGQPALVGAYSIGSGLSATVGTLFIAGLGGVALPLYSAVASRGDEIGLRKLWRANVLLTTIVSVPTGVIGVFVGPYLISRVYGPQYEAAIVPFQIAMVLSTLSRVLGGGASSTLLYAKDRQSVLILARCAAALLDITVALALASPLGIAGIAAATGLASVFVVFVELLLARRAARIEFPVASTVKTLVAAGLPMLPLSFVHVGDPLTLVVVVATYGIACGALFIVVRPLEDDDLELVRLLGPRAERLASLLASGMVPRAICKAIGSRR